MKKSSNKQYLLENIESLGDTISELEYQNVFLVSGRNSFNLLKKQYEILNVISAKAVRFNEFSVNPKWEELQSGIKLFNNNTCTKILAIGGGSVIDMAKLVKYYADFNVDEFIAVPTTAGSGSESTSFAVLYKNNQKYSINRADLLPSKVILDENTLKSLSNEQLTISALDATCQAIESIWSNNCTEESFDLAQKALRFSLRGLNGIINGVYLYHDLMKGSNLAGQAINISKTTAAHAISYYLTSSHRIPHGVAVALTIPFFIQYNFYKSINESNSNISLTLHERLKYLTDIFDKETIDLVSITFHELLQNLPIKRYDLSGIDINEVESNVNVERLSNNPVNLDFSDLKDYFQNPKKWLERN